MKFTDILALAKQGYTPADIRELLALTVEEKTEAETMPKPSDEAADPDSDPEPIQRAEAVQGTGGDMDEAAERIKELEAQISRLQADNARQSRPDPKPAKTDKERLEDMARAFM